MEWALQIHDGRFVGVSVFRRLVNDINLRILRISMKTGWRGFCLKLFRKILFWTHLGAGLLAGLLVLLMSVTGVLLTYEKQMINWADSDLRIDPVPPAASPLPLSALASRVQQHRNALPTGVVMESDPSVPVAFQFGRAPLVYVNQYTGEVIGEGGQRMRAFMSSMREWHRWLAASGENRAAAREITGAANVLFLFLVVSGLYLWLPKAFTWRQLRPILWFRGGLAGKARDFNWHNAAGFWCAVPLFFVVFSAVFISYPSASKLLTQWLDGEAPTAAPANPATAKADAPKKAERTELPAALDTGWTHASTQMAGWRTISLQIPKLEGEPLSFSVARGTGGQPQHRGTLQVNADTGESLLWEPFEALSAGRRARLWLRFVHTGEYYGLAGQTIAGIASAGGALLVYTGLALSWRRFFAWRARRRRQDDAEEPLRKAA